MDYSINRRIDLHIHSTASDGTFSPKEIIALAEKLNIAAIAITDHDTIDGSKEAFATDIPSGLKLLTGVEVSAAPPQPFFCSGSFHVLGYSIRLDDPLLNQTLSEMQSARENRNPAIIKLLNNLGINVSIREVLELAGDGQAGRPHIARLMLGKGYVKSIDEAFNKYLAKGKPAYVDKQRIECSRIIEIIISAGGIPVLAHPALIELSNISRFEEMMIKLKDMGLKGIEAYYPEHSKEDTSYYLNLAKKYDLLVTGGTDFHGSLKPDINMGIGRGNFYAPYYLYENLIKQLR